MANGVMAIGARRFLGTKRRDRWWMQPASVLAALIGFVIYSNWAAIFQGPALVSWGPAGSAEDLYLSPFNSPVWAFKLGREIGLPYPLFMILWIPLGFRLTCYFARRTYYRAFMADPAGCAVGEFDRRRYNGESRFPLILQNVHRYFVYFAAMLVVFHWIDIVHAFGYVDLAGKRNFYLGVGGLLMLADAGLLTLYVSSCHTVRHLIGGRRDCFTCNGSVGPGYGVYNVLSVLNRFHGLFFWLSLLAVGSADFYVRMLQAGRITDVRIL